MSFMQSNKKTINIPILRTPVDTKSSEKVQTEQYDNEVHNFIFDPDEMENVIAQLNGENPKKASAVKKDANKEKLPLPEYDYKFGEQLMEALQSMDGITPAASIKKSKENILSQKFNDQLVASITKLQAELEEEPEQAIKKRKLTTGCKKQLFKKCSENIPSASSKTHIPSVAALPDSGIKKIPTVVKKSLTYKAKTPRSTTKRRSFQRRSSESEFLKLEQQMAAEQSPMSLCCAKLQNNYISTPKRTTTDKLADIEKYQAEIDRDMIQFMKTYRDKSNKIKELIKSIKNENNSEGSQRKSERIALKNIQSPTDNNFKSPAVNNLRTRTLKKTFAKRIEELQSRDSLAQENLVDPSIYNAIKQTPSGKNILFNTVIDQCRNLRN